MTNIVPSGGDLKRGSGSDTVGHGVGVMAVVGDGVGVDVAVGSEVAVAVGEGVGARVAADSRVLAVIGYAVGVAGSDVPSAAICSFFHCAHELRTIHVVISIVAFSTTRANPDIGKLLNFLIPPSIF
jgi:hypothetical protein